MQPCVEGWGSGGCLSSLPQDNQSLLGLRNSLGLLMLQLEKLTWQVTCAPQDFVESTEGRAKGVV